MLVVAGRLISVGFQIVLVQNGSIPCVIACGHHSSPHMNRPGSPRPRQAQVCAGSASAWRPINTSDRTA